MLKRIVVVALFALALGIGSVTTASAAPAADPGMTHDMTHD